MEEVFLAFRGLVVGVHKDLIVVEMGTFLVALKRRLVDALMARGVAMLDCLFSVTSLVVAWREAVLFVSVELEIAHRVWLVLDVITSR